MAGEWRMTNLADVCDRVSVGYVGPTSEYFCESSEGVRMLRSQNVRPGRMELNDVKYVRTEFHKKNKKSQLKAGDILFVRVGQNRGDCCIVPEGVGELNCANIVFARPRRALGAFLGFYFRSLVGQQQLRSISTGSAQGVLNTGAIASLMVPIPTDDEAQAIAAMLGALDDKIELNRRMNATLEAMARALFQSWFVDFDPVRAKLDGRKPVGLDPATATLFPATFDETELGHIPHGWQVKTIDELAERVAMGPFGSDIKVSTFVPEGIPVISGQHLRGTLLDDSEFNFVSIEHADRLKRSNVQRGDVIFTHAGSIGQVAYIPEASRYERYIVSQRQFYMRCNRALVSPFYITSYFKTPEGQHRLLANTSSTGVPSISQPVTYLRQLKMVVPPPALLKVFDKTVSEIHLKMADNDHQSRTLATLRDTLLPKLLSGELSVATANNERADL